MKFISRKNLIKGIQIDENKDFGETELCFDSAFVGKVFIKFRKVGRTLIFNVEVDGYEHF